MLWAFVRSDSGATVVQHRLIALGLSVAIVAISAIVGISLDLLFGAAPVGEGIRQTLQ